VPHPPQGSHTIVPRRLSRLEQHCMAADGWESSEAAAGMTLHHDVGAAVAWFHSAQPGLADHRPSQEYAWGAAAASVWRGVAGGSAARHRTAPPLTTQPTCRAPHTRLGHTHRDRWRRTAIQCTRASHCRAQAPAPAMSPRRAVGAHRVRAARRAAPAAPRSWRGAQWGEPRSRGRTLPFGVFDIIEGHYFSAHMHWGRWVCGWPGRLDRT